EGGAGLAGGGVPESGGAVVGGGGEQGAVGGVRHRGHRAGVAGEGGAGLAGGSVPESGGAVVGGGGEQGAVGGERHPVHGAGVAGEGAYDPALQQVHDLHEVSPAYGDEVTIRGEGEAVGDTCPGELCCCAVATSDRGLRQGLGAVRLGEGDAQEGGS